MKHPLVFGLLFAGLATCAHAADRYQTYLFDVVKQERGLAGSIKKEIEKIQPGNYAALASGPQAPGEKLTLNGQTYYLYSMCEQHNCADNNAAIFYSPKTRDLAGYVFQSDCSVKTFGNTSSAMQSALAQYLGTDESLNRCK
ncbi:Ivy family c-type lysozyme inhibitor [Craterilacuibacter sp. RT1T]|uniref:Ivy family c-type lysozyme inhibitor n=1 Tax=Craterilacuibacter sp. RT1T TaxID=2942211 RepID=UPI0020BD8624|nr:Ivy family c-type lysozyme inhibitor [Craterilacuibacter sp. RT1T]MCL6262646.1 inhibitor of vertebrate lysozyme family protein [Craterilacuibacter sp. RT1T]